MLQIFVCQDEPAVLDMHVGGCHQEFPRRWFSVIEGGNETIEVRICFAFVELHVQQQPVCTDCPEKQVAAVQLTETQNIRLQPVGKYQRVFVMVANHHLFELHSAENRNRDLIDPN